jgi:uncharacterized protein YjbI with pentapeptide repeats
MGVPPAPSPPSWPHCGFYADPATDPVGCRGIHVAGHAACLAHLTDTDRDSYLASLTPAADIDHRGTPFTEELLCRLLDALRDPTTTGPRFGTALFHGAQFSGDVSFERAEFGAAWFYEAQFSNDTSFVGAQFGDAGFGSAQFSGEAGFRGARFSGAASFESVQFSGLADFNNAQFARRVARFGKAQFSGPALFRSVQFFGPAQFGEAQFSGITQFTGAQFSDNARFQDVQFSDSVDFFTARFSGDAWFDRARFSGDTQFLETQFLGPARFLSARFSGPARFGKAQFSGTARFDGAQFSVEPWFGPIACAGVLDLSGAVFAVPVTLEIAAYEVRCVRTRWESTATVRLRYATADLSYAVLSAPVAVTAHPIPFTGGFDTTVDESVLSGPAAVRVASVQGMDAAFLVLTDLDLSNCLFSGAFHLDQLRLEGRCAFAAAPTGWRRRGMRLTRWTRRRTLAEEHHWRAQTDCQPALPAGHPVSPALWRFGPHHPDPGLTPDPEDVAALYRQLRKAFEDGRNEPGAADFYYGECEMRRHDRTGTSTGERRLLWGYWLLSGYGLRASRAMGWLLAAMATTTLALMLWGLPSHDPAPATTGSLTHGKITLNTETSDSALIGPWRQRLTGPRAEKATRVVVNSVVFRSSGQNLTTTGTYIEMASRLLEPTLLALAALAVRGRIKR